MTAIYTMNPDAPRTRCPKCGETRIRRGMLAAHLRDVGHPEPIRPDSAVDADTLEARNLFRASLARALDGIATV